MQVNLKKARKLEQAILLFMNEMSFKQDFEARLKLDVSDMIAGANSELSDLQKTLETKNNLRWIRYRIREEIGAFNQSKGINKLMIEKSLIEEELSELKKLLTFPMRESSDDIQDKKEVMEKKGVSEDSLYSRRVSTKLTINLMTEKMKSKLEDKQLNLKNKLEKVENDLAKKNLMTKISLTKDEKTLLESLKII